MMFNKILKGTDLAFDISLQKTQYRSGERVRGTLSINTGRGAKARKLMLLAEGKESTTITQSETTYYGTGPDTYGTGQNTTSKTYSETNVFFSMNLSDLLQQSVDHNILQDGTLEILPQDKVIAFDFTLPVDDALLPSYKGKQANITYTIRGTVDIAKKLDVNKEGRFSVSNSNNMTAKKANLTPFKSGLRDLRLASAGKSFDLKIGHENFLKESAEAKINLSDQHNNIASYCPGHTIRGNVMVGLPQNKEGEIRKKIRGMKITLSGIEHAVAQRVQRVTTIEKYDKKIDLDENQNRANNDSSTIPFEFEIPQGVNQSYIGKYSEYFWGLEAKVNIAWSSDLIAKTIIEIV